jgi:hypothetical protein
MINIKNKYILSNMSNVKLRVSCEVCFNPSTFTIQFVSFRNVGLMLRTASRPPSPMPCPKHSRNPILPPVLDLSV